MKVLKVCWPKTVSVCWVVEKVEKKDIRNEDRGGNIDVFCLDS